MSYRVRGDPTQRLSNYMESGIEQNQQHSLPRLRERSLVSRLCIATSLSLCVCTTVVFSVIGAISVCNHISKLQTTSVSKSTVWLPPTTHTDPLEKSVLRRFVEIEHTGLRVRDRGVEALMLAFPHSLKHEVWEIDEVVLDITLAIAELYSRIQQINQTTT